MLSELKNEAMKVLTKENVKTETDIVKVRQVVRHYAKQQRFGIVDQTRLTTAVSELIRNMYQYADGGEITIEAGVYEEKKALVITCEDKGPGIKDLELAMSDGYTSGMGMGYGLPGAKRLVDDFSIETGSQGTKVRVMKWR